MYNFDKEHDMSGMNYGRSTNRYIANHTINPRWTTGKAYKPHLNSPVTVIKADGTKVVEKPLNYDEINKVNKIKKKRNKSRQNNRAAEHNKQKAEHARRSEEINKTIAENKKRYAENSTPAPKPSQIIVSHVKPVVKPAKPKPVVHMHPPVEHKFVIPTKQVNN